MCDKHIAGQLRDREFDSLVGHVQEAQPVNARLDALERAADIATAGVAQAARPDPFAAINRAWDGVIRAVASGNIQAAQERASAAIDETLQGYYQGRGKFDHVRFLADLEAAKGSALDESEYRFFGRIVGDWTGTKAADETSAALNRGDFAEAEAIFLAVLN